MKLKVRKIPLFLSWRGLLWQKPKPVVFQTRFGIHTFGMKYSIDVLILDKMGNIKKMKQNLKPNRFFFWNPRYSQVIELPKGTLKKLKISQQQKIDLQTF